MTPAERLLAAADLLDKRAGEATEGPWVAEAASAIVILPGGRADKYTAWSVSGSELDDEGGAAPVAAVERDARNGSLWGGIFNPADAAYIATMHPEVGKAQAAMLRVLGSVDYPEVRMGASVHTQKVFDAALALADLLLAGVS